MNLIVRYIQAVKNELPKENRDDIAKELQSTLEDELEALSEKEGQLSNAQVAAFLEQRGHPVQVASQYWKRRSLISETVYPLYTQTLVLFCSIYLALGVLLNFEDFLTIRDWSSVGKLPNLFFDLFSSVAFAFVVITLVFHFFGDEIATQKWVWHFNAQNLPDVDSQSAFIARTETISHVASNLFALALLTFGTVTFRNLNITVDWSPIAGWLEVLRYLLLADLGLNLLHLVQPYWTRAKLWANMLLSAGMVLCLTMMVTTPKITISSSTVFDLTSLELSLRVTFGIFIAVILWSVFDTLRRVWRINLPTV
jgi:hypothetical protein